MAADRSEALIQLIGASPLRSEIPVKIAAERCGPANRYRERTPPDVALKLGTRLRHHAEPKVPTWAANGGEERWSAGALRFPAMRAVVGFATLIMVFAACGDEAATGTSLTEAERDWCEFTDASEADAARFDAIFQAGRRLGLDMDALNAIAADLRSQYEAEGMSSREAVRAVSDDLFEIDAFVLACREAYASRSPAP